MSMPAARGWRKCPRRSSNWPLIVKFSIAPALALGLLSIMAVIEISALRNDRDDTRHIVMVNMQD